MGFEWESEKERDLGMSGKESKSVRPTTTNLMESSIPFRSFFLFVFDKN
jgi:hypothetical protein